jgi:hypothetical protein
MQVSITIIGKFNARQFKYSVKAYTQQKAGKKDQKFILTKELKSLTLPLHDGGTFA